MEKYQANNKTNNIEPNIYNCFVKRNQIDFGRQFATRKHQLFRQSIICYCLLFLFFQDICYNDRSCNLEARECNKCFSSSALSPTNPRVTSIPSTKCFGICRI